MAVLEIISKNYVAWFIGTVVRRLALGGLLPNQKSLALVFCPGWDNSSEFSFTDSDYAKTVHNPQSGIILAVVAVSFFFTLDSSLSH